ncbi:hypothetical protein MASR2M15_24930 [Anaerolineales bacterium]
MLILMLIARSYHRFTGRLTLYRIFILPIILYAVFSVRYAAIFINDPPDLIFSIISGVSGILLMILVASLYRTMMQPKQG